MLASLRDLPKPLQLTSIVEDNGACVLEPRRDGSIPIEKVTHIIANTIDFEQYEDSQAYMIPVVTAQWITVSVTRRKQSQVRPFSPDPRMIFSEVVVTCADLPRMDKESILGATMALGGQESKDATRMTSHICALSMDHPKVQAALQKNWKGKVVLPHWYVAAEFHMESGGRLFMTVLRFDDCFKLGKRIDEGPYLLPDPEILKEFHETEVEIPENKNINGATSANPQSLPWPPLPPDGEASRPPVTVFQDHMVMLSSDLNINNRLSTAIQDIITHGGGRIVDQVEHCDIFICQYRDGPQYVRAAQNCKTVGNLSWLYYLIVHNEWASPRRRLLHYPIPRNGIEGFQDFRITVSNYGGEARIYLENLVKACGAEFTKTMKADNTHLITARNSSEKCKVAPEWGVAVVNHLWIEESYAKCELRPINVKKYNHFPLRTNLGEVIGQTFFDESRLRELYYPGSEEGMSPRTKRKRKVLEAAEENAYQQGPAEGVVIGLVEQDDVVSGEDHVTPARTRGSKSAQVVTPVTSRRVQSGKENETPPMASSGGRSAKAKARNMLQHIAPDIALYEKEKKRHSKGGTSPWGGRRAADLAEKEKSLARTSPGEKNDNAGEVADRPAKRSRPSLPEVQMRIILTGFGRWVGDKTREDHDRVCREDEAL